MYRILQVIIGAAGIVILALGPMLYREVKVIAEYARLQLTEQAALEAHLRADAAAAEKAREAYEAERPQREAAAKQQQEALDERRRDLAVKAEKAQATYEAQKREWAEATGKRKEAYAAQRRARDAKREQEREAKQ